MKKKKKINKKRASETSVFTSSKEYTIEELLELGISNNKVEIAPLLFNNELNCAKKINN